MEPLNVDISETRGVKVITLSGEIDIYGAPLLRSSLVDVAESNHSVVADLKSVVFLDSTALGVLVGALKKLRSRGSDLVLSSASERVVRVFEVTGLTDVFKMYPDLDSALDAIESTTED